MSRNYDGNLLLLARLVGLNRKNTTTARFDQCGNDCDKAFRVNLGNETHTFDSFECVIEKLAPLRALVVEGGRQ